MIRKWCDACGKEVTDKPNNNIDVPCHLYSFKGEPGYIDSEGMPTSGRYDNILVCSKCWNRGYYALLDKLNLPNTEVLYENSPDETNDIDNEDNKMLLLYALSADDADHKQYYIDLVLKNIINEEEYNKYKKMYNWKEGIPS